MWCSLSQEVATKGRVKEELQTLRHDPWRMPASGVEEGEPDKEQPTSRATRRMQWQGHEATREHPGSGGVCSFNAAERTGEEQALINVPVCLWTTPRVLWPLYIRTAV